MQTWNPLKTLIAELLVGLVQQLVGTPSLNLLFASLLALLIQILMPTLLEKAQLVLANRTVFRGMKTTQPPLVATAPLKMTATALLLASLALSLMVRALLLLLMMNVLAIVMLPP